MQAESLVAKAELTPTGSLRIGVVMAPAPSTFFVVQHKGVAPEGVTVVLGRHLAAALGVRAEFVSFHNSGELTDAIEGGSVDVGFVPVDDERKKRVSFGPSYVLIESTALVHGNSDFETVTDLNIPGVKVAGITNTTTIRSAQRVLQLATVIPVRSVNEAMEWLKARQVDAVILPRDVLGIYCAGIVDSRVLEGKLHATGIAIAVQKGRVGSLTCVSHFLDNAKASGMVRQVFDQAGFHSESVAPMGV